MRRQLQRIGHQVAEQEAVVRQCQQDALQGMEVIRVYGIADWIRDRFLAERDLLEQVIYKKNVVVARTTSIIIYLLPILDHLYGTHCRLDGYPWNDGVRCNCSLFYISLARK